MNTFLKPAATVLIMAFTALAQVNAQVASYKMTTDIPASVTTPDIVETSLGTLRFFDGFPDPESVKKVYDNLDFHRGMEAFLNNIPAASAYSLRTGLRTFGPDNQTLLITESLMDSRGLFLTGNTETIYSVTWLNTHEGPLVIELPAGILGMINDFWFRFVSDVGLPGPDQGKGGKYLLLPPDYSGEIPDGYFVIRSSTYGNFFFYRIFAVNGDMKKGIDDTKRIYRAYPLKQAGNPPATNFIDISGKYINTIHSNDFHFYEELNHVIQEEPLSAVDPENRGLLAAIGIQKGLPFAPDERMKVILTDAVAVANATARSILFDSRDKAAYFYPNSSWKTCFVGQNTAFSPDGVLNMDARSYYYYVGSGNSPACFEKSVGHLSQYAFTEHDKDGKFLDGSKTYKLRLPPNVPVNNFWSLLVYDPQTRSMLQTDQRLPSLSSLREELVINQDSSIDIWFGPKPPDRKEVNWIMTVPGKGWFPCLRLYGPLEPWFDKSWRPGEVELINDIPPAAVNPNHKYKMTTDIPRSITTPDVVETSLGTFRFFDGFPDAATSKKAYDNLDFQRGKQVFLNTIQIAGLYATREGYRSIGPDNQTILISESFLDSRSLYFIANSETIYLTFWLDIKQGPMVIEVPSDVLGLVNDFSSRYVTDVGRAGRDKGAGGKYLILPPSYTGEVPEGYFPAKSNTYGNFVFIRGFVRNGDIQGTVERMKKNFHVYPLASASNPPAINFVNISGKYFNCIPANDMTFYYQVNGVVQEEPLEAVDPEIRGLLASIGIQKGKPFNPDDRMKGILDDAVKVGNATARALFLDSRDPDAYLYTSSQWKIGYIGNDHTFSPGGILDQDARTYFSYNATGISPAMSMKMIGLGSQYSFTARDSKGNYFDGSKYYRLHLPPNPPAKDFWSIIVYDLQTRSMLQTDQQYPSVNSQNKGVIINPDSSIDIYFGPETPPIGKKVNWIQTIPGKSWLTFLRLYGPLEPWFDKTWRAGEVEEVNPNAMLNR